MTSWSKKRETLGELVYKSSKWTYICGCKRWIFIVRENCCPSLRMQSAQNACAVKKKLLWNAYPKPIIERPFLCYDLEKVCYRPFHSWFGNVKIFPLKRKEVEKKRFHLCRNWENYKRSTFKEYIRIKYVSVWDLLFFLPIFQVPPAELEALLITHPKIDDVAVIGVPDLEAGELPKAFVVRRGNVTSEEIMEFVAKKILPHKKLRGGVEFIDQIPKSASGKILRRLLRNQEKQKRAKASLWKGRLDVNILTNQRLN